MRCGTVCACVEGHGSERREFARLGISSGLIPHKVGSVQWLENFRTGFVQQHEVVLNILHFVLGLCLLALCFYGRGHEWSGIGTGFKMDGILQRLR
jgi:hypothetical protein